MTYHYKKTGLASALALGVTVIGLAGAANAATLSLLDPSSQGAVRAMPNDHDLGNNDNIAPGWSQVGYDALVPTGTGRIGDDVTSFHGSTKDSGNGISVSKDSFVTFTYLGSEAGFTNLAVELINDTVVFRNRDTDGDPETNFAEKFTMRFGPGLIPFLYETEGNDGGTIANNGDVTGTSPMEIAYGSIFNNGQSVNVFFGDGAGDSDLDDLGMRIDVSAVPLPAAGWLMLAGFGGLAALRRRKRTA